MPSALGYSVTAVCTVAAYSYSYDTYVPHVDYEGTHHSETAIVASVDGANCSLRFHTNIYDPNGGEAVPVYNITGLSQDMINNYFAGETLEPYICNIDSSGTCSTQYVTFSGGLFQEMELDWQVPNILTEYDPWWYVVLPPVPSQPVTPALSADH